MDFSKHWALVLDDYAIDLGWSADGRLLAVASAAGGIVLSDAANGSVLHRLPGHEDGANCIAWGPGGLAASILASGGQDGAVRLWNAVTGLQEAETPLNAGWVEHLTWVPRAADADPLVAASAGRRLALIQTAGTITHEFPPAPKTITALAATPAHDPRGPLVAAAYFGGVCAWDVDARKAWKEFAYGNAIHALVWSPDGRWLVAGCQDNAVHLWVPAEDIELHMSGYETKLKELAFSHDSNRLATGGGRDACVWDCSGAGPEGREPMLLPHTARVSAVAFQNAHGLLATAAADGNLSIWAVTRRNPVVAEARLPSPATRLAWSPDDSLLAVGTEMGAVYVFQVRTGS